jgi:hypothetical protein
MWITTHRGRLLSCLTALALLPAGCGDHAAPLEPGTTHLLAGADGGGVVQVAPPTGDVALTYERVVYPVGAYPQDVENVQAAVDLGGTVLLKARNAEGVPTAFDFGPAVAGSGGVALTTDVVLVGEAAGGVMTTIRGGNAPIRTVLFQPVRAKVLGIFFDGPRATAVDLVFTNGFEFRDSRVEGVVPFLFFIDPEDGEVYKAQAIWIGRAGVPEFLTGDIVIENNDLVDSGLGGVLGYGMAVAPGNASMRIANNRIRGANLAGIWSALNRAPLVIEGNTIDAGPGDAYRTWGNAIMVLGTFSGGPVTVLNNDISVQSGDAHGILMFGDEEFNGPLDGAVIQGNRIEVRDGWAGIGLHGSIWNAQVRQNRIRGDAIMGLTVSDLFEQGDEAVRNVFIGNSLGQFRAAGVDVFFDAHTRDHALAGHSGLVIDLGIGNRITGSLTSLPHHLGERIRSRKSEMSGWSGLSP